MKLMMVLMLATLPFYSYAGSGCVPLESALNKVIDPSVSVEEYTTHLQKYILTDATKVAVEELKQCFLNQSNETLANVQVLEYAIFDSLYCAAY
ncbi:mammaglobin-A-like [Lepus europaeus]|uniref:mammaglobin-A-like n=1 Tax=Lepus europaeus TaxID=9983 RepID=UPI002B488B0B|nr:mammaglobin-A-like [Lepus europaeus]